MRIHHLTLTVTDADRSAHWYQALLGPASIIERAGEGWRRVRMQWPDGLVIGVTQHDSTPPGDHFDHTRVGLDHVGLDAGTHEEVQRWAAHMDALGITRGPVEDVPYGWAVTARDPDGIAVECYAHKA